MNKHAIFHIANLPYAYPLDGNTLFVNIRTAKNDIKLCEVFYKDRYEWGNPFKSAKMKVKYSNELFDYYQINLSISKKRYRYYFRLEDFDGNMIYLTDQGFKTKLNDNKEQGCFQFPYMCSKDIYTDISWAQESIVYQIFPDRFCNGDKSNDPENTLPWGSEVTPTTMFGGDLQGIIDKLDYLSDLGIDIIYLTPIFLSSSNHKYNTADYYEIDPHFGDIAKAKELVKKCHDKGIKILFDAVFNHSGSDFFAFKDVIKNGEKSRYKDWFFINSFPVDTEKVNYVTFGDEISTMPKLNTANPEVREYLLKVAEYWIKEVGIDGWRLDVCDEVDHYFWREFRKTVKNTHENALVIGEVMHDASSFLRGDELDGIMNYPFKELMVDYFAKRNISSTEFAGSLISLRVNTMEQISKQMFNLIGCHDTVRFLTEANDNVDALRLAAAFQFTYIGIPYIYYGDEIGMNGGYDPGCRRCMIWDEDRQNTSLKEFYKKLISIRKNNKVLVYGECEFISAPEGVTAFKRLDKDTEILVLINNSSETKNISVEDSIDTNKMYVDLLNSKNVSFDREIQLLPNEIKILK